MHGIFNCQMLTKYSLDQGIVYKMDIHPWLAQVFPEQVGTSNLLPSLLPFSNSEKMHWNKIWMYVLTHIFNILAA